MIGLKRGVVELVDHNPEWGTIAAETIRRLRRIFGTVAVDIQHVGSTSIAGIKAKPIIDIAVAVEDFSYVEPLIPALEANGFLRRHWETDEQMLFAVGDYSKPDGIQTHFIHVVKANSPAWRDYINFRNYLNANSSVAKEYEALKVKLAKENPHDKGREKYLAGKHDFIVTTLQTAQIWENFGKVFTQITPINKGWSEDKKYCVTKADGTKYLLRITPISRYETRKALFEILQRVAALGIPMCKPIEFGTCENGVYALHSWIDGEDAEIALPMLSETEQYVLGLKAGEILRKIHSIPAPETQEEWASRFNCKIDNKIKKYRTCGLRFFGDDKVIEYIENNRQLLEDRPQSFQHGDYHVGNMMIENGELRIIDFDRYDFGDSWEEFNRIVWCAAASPYFATGQLRGYFGGEPPMEFFKLLAFYIASNTLSSIYWAIPFGQGQIDTMMKQSQDVLKWFDNMRNPVPAWYLKNFYLQWIDGVPLKLKAPFDLSFLGRYGRVFKVFDDQDSGNLCFGVQDGGNRYFVKFAGAPTEQYNGDPADAVARLKAAAPVYQELAHPALIRFVDAGETGGGYAVVFEWVDAVCMGKQYPNDRAKFITLPIQTKLRIFDEILTFHAYAAEKGYVAIDFYDGSIMWDAVNERTIICDVDFYAKSPYINEKGKLWGSTRFMSPEEYQLGAVIDEVTNVYTMGATAFCLFADSDRSPEKWLLSEARYAVAKKAVSDERGRRQQSIRQLIEEWEAAK